MPLSPDEAVAALTDPAAPYLIGVRHHAPSLAAAVPALLEAAAPDVVLVELPEELQAQTAEVWVTVTSSRTPSEPMMMP
ncbi:hypothetical protein, partial [Streptomyces sp. NPDC003832]